MSSDPSSELFWRFLDGDLSPSELQEFASILARSPELLKHLQQHLLLDDLLSQKYDPRRSDQPFLDALRTRLNAEKDETAFLRKVQQHILSENAPPSPATRRTTASFRRAPAAAPSSFALPALAAAGVLFVVALFLAVRFSGSAPTPSEPGARNRFEIPPPPQEEARNRTKQEFERLEIERRKLQELLEQAEQERRRLTVSPPREKPDPAAEEEHRKALARQAEEQKKIEADLRAAEEKQKKLQEELVRIEKESTGSTVVAAATALEDVKGEVHVVANSGRSRAIKGQAILPGQRVVTKGTGSLAVIAHPDGTRLAMGADAEVLYADAPEKIFLKQGKLDVEAAKRAKGEEKVIATPQAEVRILGTRFALTSTPAFTRLEMREGVAEFTDLLKGRSVRVEAGRQAVARGFPGVDPVLVNAAIKKGTDYLRSRQGNWGGSASIRSLELVLWTYLHAGVPRNDPGFQKCFATLMQSGLENTYGVSLQAMILEEMDRVKYHERIAQCAQFLVDNQCANGQWGYGTPADLPSFAAQRKIFVKKRRSGPAEGDNSNSQYAALGLRACHDAGIVISREVIELAKKGWVESRHAGRAQGWCYGGRDHGHPAYGSMTAGAVASLCIYDSILNGTLSWKKDPAAQSGLAWLAGHFTVAENPGPPEECAPGWMQYYYLYAMERAGILYGTETFDKNEWYPKGVEEILKTQQVDGSWLSRSLERVERDSAAVWDTCFAILFLRRATRPLAE